MSTYRPARPMRDSTRTPQAKRATLAMREARTVRRTPAPFDPAALMAEIGTAPEEGTK